MVYGQINPMPNLYQLDLDAERESNFPKFNKILIDLSFSLIILGVFMMFDVDRNGRNVFSFQRIDQTYPDVILFLGVLTFDEFLAAYIVLQRGTSFL